MLNLLFVSKITGATTIIPQGWALEVLVQVYLVLPALVLAVARSGRPILLITGLFLFGVALRFHGLVSDPASWETPFYSLLYGNHAERTQQMLYTLLPYRSTPFLAGLLVAVLVVDHGARVRSALAVRGVTTGLLILGLVLVGVCGFLPVQDQFSFLYQDNLPGEAWLWFWTLQRPVFVTGLAAITIALLFTPRAESALLSGVFGWKLFFLISRNIYSLYLFHLGWLLPAAIIVFHTTNKATLTSAANWQVFGLFGLTAAFSLLFAWPLTRFIEVPLRNWLRGRFLRRTPRAD